MTLSTRLLDRTAHLRQQASSYATDAARTVADARQQLNGIARDTAERLFEANASLLKGWVGEGSERLRMLSKAADLRSAAKQQMAYFDVTRERVVRDLRANYAVATDAGRSTTELAVHTYQALRLLPRAAAPRTKAAAPKGKPTAKARKTVTRVSKPAKGKSRKAA